MSHADLSLANSEDTSQLTFANNHNIMTTTNDTTMVQIEPAVLDLVLGEWMSVTSLPTPKILLVGLCCYNVDAVTSEQQATLGSTTTTKKHNNNNSNNNDESKTYLRVEAFGSGVEIVTTTAFDADTMTVSDLFSLVRRHIERGLRFRLLYCGHEEITPNLIGDSLLTNSVGGLAGTNEYVFSVVVESAGILTVFARSATLTPVAKKTRGCAIGCIVEAEDGTRFVAKVGLPDQAHQISNSVSPERGRFQRSAISVIKEKIAADVYGILGCGHFYVPKHRLALMKIMNEFTNDNELAQALAQHYGMHDSVHVLSQLIDGYQDICHLSNCSPDGKPFMECLNAGYAPEYAAVDGVSVPILGLMEILAASRLLADTDVLGGAGGGVGFVVERGATGVPVAVRLVNIDAGDAFNFSGENNQFVQYCSLTSVFGARSLGNAKDFQFGNYEPKNILWSKLSEKQRLTFLRALQSGLEFLRNECVLDFLIYREGQFDKADDDSYSLMIDEFALPFKASWKRYRELQTHVYGDMMTALPDPTTAAPFAQVPFVPTRYGAVNYVPDEITWLSTKDTTK